eukprot:1159123-Pelagomonas_calceolata.AAC.1
MSDMQVPALIVGSFQTLFGGSKLSLTALQRLLELQQVDWSVLWEKIVEVVLACLFVVQAAKNAIIGQQKHSFTGPWMGAAQCLSALSLIITPAASEQ